MRLQYTHAGICLIAVVTFILAYYIITSHARIYTIILPSAQNLFSTSQPTSMSFHSRQTCQTICKNLDEIMTRKLLNFQVNDNQRNNRSINTTLYIWNNNVSSHLIGGSWMFREGISKQTDSSDGKCYSVPKSGVAIIFVCNNRWQQLAVTLSKLLKILQKQRLCYRIFVIEQSETRLINKAKLMNVGFLEARKRFEFDCVVFHDADLAPLDDRIPYGCDNETFKGPVHLGVGLDTNNFTLLYPTLIGGVLKISNKHFMSVNGYSNLYWGWGQEDDDLEQRLQARHIRYFHMNPSIAHYMSVPHVQQPKTNVKQHMKLLRQTHSRMKYDGLNSVNYKIISISLEPYFTHILVSIGA